MASSSAATAAAAPASGLPVLTLPQPYTIRELQQHFADRRRAAPVNETVQSESADPRPQILLHHWAIVASFLPPRDAVRLTKLSSTLYLAQEALRPLQHCTLKLTRFWAELHSDCCGVLWRKLRLEPLWEGHFAAAAAGGDPRAVYRRLALLSGVGRLVVTVFDQNFFRQQHVFANPAALCSPTLPSSCANVLPSTIQLLANLCNVTHLTVGAHWHSDQYVMEDDVLHTMALAHELVRRNQHTLEDLWIYIDDGSDGGGYVVGDTRQAQMFLLQDVNLPRVQKVSIRTPFQSGLNNVQWPRVQSLSLEGFPVTEGGVYECQHTRRCVEGITKANQTAQGGDSGGPGVVLVTGVSGHVDTGRDTDAVSKLCALVSALSTGASTVSVKTDSSRVSTVSQQKAIVPLDGAHAFVLRSVEDLPDLSDNGDTRQLPGDVQRFARFLGMTLTHAVMGEVRCDIPWRWQTQNDSCPVYQRLVLSALGNTLHTASLSNPLLLPGATHSPATPGLCTFVVSLESPRQQDPQQVLTSDEVESSALGQVLAGGGLTYTGCYRDATRYEPTWKHTFVRLPPSCAHQVATVSKLLKARVPHTHWRQDANPDHTAFFIVHTAAAATLPMQWGSGQTAWSEQQAVCFMQAAFTAHVLLTAGAYVAHAEAQERVRPPEWWQKKGV